MMMMIVIEDTLPMFQRYRNKITMNSALKTKTFNSRIERIVWMNISVRHYWNNKIIVSNRAI